MYDITPDIIFVVRQLSRHNTNLRKGYFWATKRVVRYLKGTIEIKLTFGQERDYLPRDLLSYKLIGFVDSNLVGDPEESKSIMGYSFFLNGVVVSWSGKKQRIVSTSITEVKYIMLEYTTRNVV